jgi:hypothetical protein
MFHWQQFINILKKFKKFRILYSIRKKTYEDNWLNQWHGLGVINRILPNHERNVYSKTKGLRSAKCIITSVDFVEI